MKNLGLSDRVSSFLNTKHPLVIKGNIDAKKQNSSALEKDINYGSNKYARM